MSLEDLVIGFIGGGNMARAIVDGILRKGLTKNSKIIVSSPSDGTLLKWKESSIITTHENSEVIRKADIIFLTFKPYQLKIVFEKNEFELYRNLSSKLFISVLAGISLQTLYEVLTSQVQANLRLIRVVPNIAATVCESCSAISLHSSALLEDKLIATKIFSALGKCDIVPEHLISAFTGVAGSGPAYIYMIIEALSDGGVKQGLPRELSTIFAAQTVLGAAKMVLETKKHPGQLKDEVCSAGGTTIHGMHALEKGGLRATLMNAVEAAAQRADEIGRLNK